MNFKKLTAAVTAVMCGGGRAMYIPLACDNVYAAELGSNDFEVNYDGWHGRNESVKLTAVDGQGYGGTRGMIVSDRTSSDYGASSS